MCSICNKNYYNVYTFKNTKFRFCYKCVRVSAYKHKLKARKYLLEHDHMNPEPDKDNPCNYCKGKNTSKYKSCDRCRKSNKERAQYRKDNPDLLHNKCLICNRKTYLHVDHSHRTGEIRGLLCPNCNTTIGCTDDNPHLLHNIYKITISRIGSRQHNKFCKELNKQIWSGK